jgi:hypothetical protein
MSTPTTPACVVCGEPFIKKGTAKTCGPVCSGLLMRDRHRLYREAHRETSRAASRRYREAVRLYRNRHETEPPN